MTEHRPRIDDFEAGLLLHILAHPIVILDREDIVIFLEQQEIGLPPPVRIPFGPRQRGDHVDEAREIEIVRMDLPVGQRIELPGFDIDIDDLVIVSAEQTPIRATQHDESIIAAIGGFEIGVRRYGCSGGSS